MRYSIVRLIGRVNQTIWPASSGVVDRQTARVLDTIQAVPISVVF